VSPLIAHSYKACDGTDIAYEVGGPSDGPVVVLCDGVGCEGYIWRYMLPRLTGHYRVIHPFYRGHGPSQDPADINRVQIDDLCADIEGILAQEGVENAVTLGHSMGVQISLELIHRGVFQFQGAALVCGAYGNPLDTFNGSDVLAKIVPYIIRAIDRFPGPVQAFWNFAANTPIAWYVATLTELNPALARKEDFSRYMQRLGDIDPGLFFRMVKAAGDHTAEPYLAQMEIPILVVAAEDDGYTPMSLSKKMADLLPKVDLMVVPGASHAAPVEVPGPINTRVLRFLNEVYRSSSSKKSVSAV